MVDTYGTQCEYGEISGFGLWDSLLIGYRFPFEQPFSAFTMESWVIWATEDDEGNPIVHYPYGHAGWLSGLWLTEDRTLYVTDLEGRLYVHPLEQCRETPWIPVMVLEQDNFLHGVHGLDDGTVVVWAKADGRPYILHGTHPDWTHIDGPGFEIAFVRGLSASHLFAAGVGGELALWDGQTWTPLLGGGDRVNGVAVVDSEQFWICTASGKLLEGHTSGLEERAATPGLAPLADVALFGGHVWLAAVDLGLMRFRSEVGALEMIKPNIPAQRFDARGALVTSCPHLVASTDGNGEFYGGLINSFADARGRYKPLWEA